MDKTLELRLKREELLNVNDELFNILAKRQSLVSEISQIKNSLNYPSNWDAQQEKKLFVNLKDKLLKMAVHELFFFSFLMEKHATEGPNYPSWSSGEHLERVKSKNSVDFTRMINPVLLFIVNRREYDSLSIKALYRNQIESEVKE